MEWKDVKTGDILRIKYKDVDNVYDDYTTEFISEIKKASDKEINLSDICAIDGNIFDNDWFIILGSNVTKDYTIIEKIGRRPSAEDIVKDKYPEYFI